MTSDADKIAKLEAEIDALKAKVSPPKSNFVPMSDAEWIDRMHQMRERRMNFASNFHPDDIRAMEAACPTSAVKDIVAHGHIPSPSGMAGASGQVTRVSSNPGIPGSGTGWQAPTPLSNPPGTNWVDAICIADDVRQRKEKKG
jgi:hypothetical protein